MQIALYQQQPVMETVVRFQRSRFAAHSFSIGTGPFKKRNSNLKEKQKLTVEPRAKPFAGFAFLSDETFIHDSDKWLWL